MNRIASTVFATLVALVLSAAVAAGDPPEVTGAWARATPPGAANGAVYLTLHNPGATPVEVTGVSRAPAARAELHESMIHDGMMRMKHLPDGFTVAPGASVTLKPGGKHVMLLGLEKPLAKGMSFELVLQTSGGALPVTVEVGGIAAMPPSDIHDEMHGGMTHGSQR